MVHDEAIGIIRTVVPALVGAFLTWLIADTSALPNGFIDDVSAAAVALVTAIYYALVTTLERKVNPAFGWLLGFPKAPHYPSRGDSTG